MPDGKVVPIDDDGSDEDEEAEEDGPVQDDIVSDDDDDSDQEQPARRAARRGPSSAEARAAAKQAAQSAIEDLIKERDVRSDDAWEMMEGSAQQAYIDEFLSEAVLALLDKARTNHLNPFLKATLRTEAKEMIPVTEGDLAADSRVCAASKAAFEGDKGDQWPHMCFLPGFDDVSPTHGFTKCVIAVAGKGGIERRSITHNLIGFVAYSMDMVASVDKRLRGSAARTEVCGDLEDYTHWLRGIKDILKFMSSSHKCPTT